MFAAYRYRAVFTDSPFQLVEAESQHRGHAIVERVFGDLFDGPLAHLPSSGLEADPATAVRFVRAHREEFGVAPLCRVVALPVSTFL